MQTTWRCACLNLLVMAAGLSGCGVEVAQQATPATTRALWDPSAAVMPTPTDLVRDAEAGRLALPISVEMNEAEREFRAYLNGLDGYPLSTALAIPMSGPIDPATLPGALVVMDLDSRQSVAVDAAFDPETDTIRAVAPRRDAGSSLQPGRRYVFGLWGEPGGVRGAAGEPVVADAAFYYVRQPSPLTEHEAAMPGTTRAERQATAAQLHEVQQAYAPLLAAMTERGIAREAIAVVSAFTTSARPAIWFDPVSGQVPMPNNLLLDPDTGLVRLPIPPDADAERRHIYEGLSTYDGFSTSGALQARSTHPLGARAAHDPALRVFRHEGHGQWREELDLERGVLDDGHTAWVRPRLALEPEHDYAFVVGAALDSATGVAHEAQPPAALLRMESELTDGEGRSRIASVSDADAARLEPHRAALEPLLDSLSAQGQGRSLHAAVVPFRTTSAASQLLERRAELYRRNVRTDVVNIETTEPSGAMRLLLGNVDVIVRGQLTTLDYLDPRTHAIEPGTAPRERLIDFSLTLPKHVDRNRPVPVVLFGHGLMTSRELLYLIADELAKGGFAALSIDLPMHGERSICKLDSDCQGGARCGELGQCLHPDGSKGDLARVEIPYLVPFLRGTQYEELLSYPITSGAYFVDFDNLFGTRDHFTQAIVDLCQALRVIRGNDLSRVSLSHGAIKLDGDDVVYLGMSLGGILGASLSAVEPTLETFVLNVPGADLVRLIEHSSVFEVHLSNLLHDRGFARGSDAYFTFTNTVRWILDPVDPLNLVQHTIAQPLTYADPLTGERRRAPTKRVLIQMAEGDFVVPNESTRALSERMGVPIRTYSPPVTNHGFLFDPNPLAIATLQARLDMMEFYDAR